MLLINKTFICVAVLTVSLESRCFIITKSLIISAKEVKWGGRVWPVGVQENSRRNIRDEMRNISRCRIRRCAQTRHLNVFFEWHCVVKCVDDCQGKNGTFLVPASVTCNQPANAR